MSIIMKVAHSFARPTDSRDSLVRSLARELRMTPLCTSITQEILNTGHGKACRAVDVAKKVGCSYGYVGDVKNLLINAKVIRISGEFIIVDWAQVRRIAARTPASVHSYKSNRSQIAKAQPSLTAEAVKSLVEAEVKNQLTAMTQRMLG